MRSFRPKFLNSSGDTMVEVLIAMAVITAVLTGSFIVAQKSFVGVRDSQERSEALHILQSQIEQVRTDAINQTDETAGIYDTTPKYFCMTTSGGVPTRQNQPALGSPADFGDATKYDPGCKDIQGLYNVAITYDNSDSNNKVFRFYGTWNRIGGGQDRIEMYYRVRPGLTLAPPTVLSTPSPGGGGPGADVGEAGCTLDPATGLCAPEPGPARYRWDLYYQNRSDNPGLSVVACEWRFNDGTVITNRCNTGDVLRHDVTPPPGSWNDFPARCRQNVEPDAHIDSVVLTLWFSDGTTANDIYSQGAPRCSTAVI